MISDRLVERDAYFHNCWMELKFRRPDLFEDMSKVELTISGYQHESDTDDEPDEGIVL